MHSYAYKVVLYLSMSLKQVMPQINDHEYCVYVHHLVIHHSSLLGLKQVTMQLPNYLSYVLTRLHLVCLFWYQLESYIDSGTDAGSSCPHPAGNIKVCFARL